MTTDTTPINKFVTDGGLYGPHALGSLNSDANTQVPALFVAGKYINLAAFNNFIEAGGGVVCFADPGISIRSNIVADWVNAAIPAYGAVAIPTTGGVAFESNVELPTIDLVLDTMDLPASKLTPIEFGALLQQAGYTVVEVLNGTFAIS